MICSSSLVGGREGWLTLLLSEPSIDLVPDGDTSLTSVDIVRLERGVSPEMVRSSLHPEHGLLVVRRGEDTKSMPRVDFAIGVEDASGLDLVAPIHAVGEGDLSVDSLGGDAKGFGTDFIVRLESVQTLSEGGMGQESMGDESEGQ
jgi:hypothetical protein